MLKKFFKIFFTTCFILLLFLGCSIYAYIKITNPIQSIISEKVELNTSDVYMEQKSDDDSTESLTPLQIAINKSKRLNVLIIGLERNRTDTIMLASYDIETKKANLISIPRDTYYKRDGYNKAEANKINAVYQSENVDGLIDAVESILTIPIHKYVIVDYEAVIKSVDAIGGVDIDIPCKMSYHAPNDNPPLSIEFEPGLQHLDGQASLEFLRFRKNDDFSINIGDVGRIKHQQLFLEKYVDKVLGFNLPTVVREIYGYIDTNFSLTEVVDLCGYALGFNTENLTMQCLPYDGATIDGLSFVIPKYEESLALIYKMYEIIEE